jgi:GAF domain-containing protein
MADSPLSESLAVLSRYFVGTGTLQETLQRVAELTEQAIGPADFVGITLPVEGRERTAVFTDPASPEIDQAQYDTGEGPCLDAMRDRQVHGVESTAEDGPWPAFRRAAADHGIASTLSLPLVVDDAVVGAMNLYARVPRAFADDERDAGLQFAAQAAIVLANAQAYWDARELSARLGEAMTSRATIEQAKGILMGARGCTADAAFEALLQAAQRDRVSVREMARRIVADATGHVPVDGDGERIRD